MTKKQGTSQIYAVVNPDVSLAGYFGSEQLALDYIVEHDLNEAAILTVTRVCIVYAPDDPDWNLDEQNLRELIK